MTRIIFAIFLAVVPFSPRQSATLVDARPDHVAIFAAAHPLIAPIQWTVARQIVAASYAAGIPPERALHIGWRESRFFPDFVSRTNDYGPLQVNARWTPDIVNQTTSQRIETGVRILAEAFRECGSWAGAEHRYARGRCR